MNKYPKFAEIKGKRYKINIDYRVALECDKVSNNGKISKEERGLAVIYLLFRRWGIKRL